MPSQATAFSSANCKTDRPPWNFVAGQLFTMCNVVCGDASQEQDGSEAWFQRTRLAAHQPWPVRKWFDIDHKRRRRSNIGGAMEGSTINEQFTTSEAAHSSVYFCRTVTLLPVVILRAIRDVLLYGGLCSYQHSMAVHAWCCFQNARNLQFLFELRRLFALMVASKRKYVDPSKSVEILKKAFSCGANNSFCSTDNQQVTDDFIAAIE